MKTQFRQTMQLGDLVAAAFDEAAYYSSDARVVSRLAAGAVMHVLGRARRASISRSSEWTELPRWRTS